MFRILLSVWALTVVAGSLFLTHYSNRPGKAAIAPESWPSESSLSLSADKATLLVLLHPQCSCSKATLAELERIMMAAGSSVHAQLVFFDSPNMENHWVEGDLWEKAERIPGVQLVRDTDGDANTTIRRIYFWTNATL